MAETKQNTTRDIRFPAMLDVGIMLLLFFAVQVAVAALFAAFGFGVPDVSGAAADDIEALMRAQTSRGESLALLYPVSMVLSVLLIGLYVRLRSGHTLRIHLSARGFNPNIILYGLVWIVAAQIMAEPVAGLLPEIPNQGVGRGFWACVTAILFAPVLEESLCRGLVLESVRRRWGDAVGVIVSALFFGILHVEPSTAFAGFVVGLILGSVYIRTSSLFSVIILHSINNAMAFALICIGMEDVPLREAMGGGKAYLAVWAAAAAIFLLFGVETWRRIRATSEK